MIVGMREEKRKKVDSEDGIEGKEVKTWSALPDVVLDILLGRILEAEEIILFHQVCKDWSKAVEARANVNERRKELVQRRNQNKENTSRDSEVLDLKPDPSILSEEKSFDSKPGLRHAIRRKILCSSSSSNASSVQSAETTPKISSSKSTPKSRYQIQREAALKLKEGEVLSPCPECRSPVPSPSPTRSTVRNISRVCVNGIPDLSRVTETEDATVSESTIPSNRILQPQTCQCPTCSYRFCPHCKFKEHPDQPCREIDGESTFISESDRLRISKALNHKNGKVFSKRRKNLALRRIANL